MTKKDPLNKLSFFSEGRVGETTLLMMKMIKNWKQSEMSEKEKKMKRKMRMEIEAIDMGTHSCLQLKENNFSDEMSSGFVFWH